MTIKEIIEQEEGEFDRIIYEEGVRFEDATEITESDVSESDEARDYSTVNDDDGRTLYILVQPEKVIRYIHVGAPAPQYAISSIHRIEGAIVQAAIAVGVYARTERSRNEIPCDIILEPDTTEEQVKDVFSKAKEDMIDDGYTGVDSRDTTLYYDAGNAEALEMDSTRNW